MNEKVRIEDLALFGGPPAFTEALHVGRPNMGDRTSFFKRLDEMIDRRWFTNNGPLVQDLEAQIANLLGVRHCVATCNATIALQIVIRALGLSGEVIVPSFTFVATVHALAWQEIEPVFCDVDPSTHNIDPREVSQLITPRTSAVIGVHVWGRPCDTEALGAIAKDHKLKIIYDAAHAFACSHGGRMIGNFGNAEVFSFHATKFFNTLEGGAITTNNDELAHRLRLLRNFGFSGNDAVIHLGINGKMVEASAAMGLTSLECLSTFIDVNRSNYAAYRRVLANVPGISLVEYDPAQESNYQYIVVDVNREQFGMDRDSLVNLLHKENVLARRYFHPGCHRMEPYVSATKPRRSLVVTEHLTSRLMSMPNGTAVGTVDIEKLGSILRFVAANAKAITDRSSRIYVSTSA